MKKSLKTFSGIVLIIIAFGLIAALAFPALSDSDHAGRTQKQMVVNLPFLKNEKSELILVYFGYVGCTRICTPALNDLTQIYHEFQHQKLKRLPSVWFVNMTPEMDSFSVQSWAEHFDKDFKSYAPHENELHSMVQLLNLVYSDLGVEAEHMPYLYLIRKVGTQYELVYIYTSSPYNRKLILKDIGELQ